MFKKTLVIAAPVLASAAIVAGGLGASSMQANATDNDHPTVSPAKQVDTTTCDGGVQKAVWNRGVSGWINADSDSGPYIMPNSVIHVQGPQSGRDVLSVNLTAGSYLDSGSEGRVKVLLDGVPMAPSDLNTGSQNFYAGYGEFGQNYCRNIGPGGHSLRVVLSDADYGAAGSFSFYLYDPMVHVEQSN